ncbi:type VI secretion system baseplate subunit TssG, partial [Pseudomonas viridiflava]|uniref:type VI secretion system baseplate subunit TssG n=1 Tax=Pseudomonas viridiflava TaxID=33069 RepID=UPI0013CF2958
LVLGQQVADRCGKFKVHLMELSWQRFHAFLPTGKAFLPLCSLVQLTARAPLAFDLRLVLAEGEIRALHIGERNVCRPGWTSWLAHERADGALTLAGHSD